MIRYLCTECDKDTVHWDLNEEKFWCDDCMSNTEVEKYYYDEETNTGIRFKVSKVSVKIQTEEGNDEQVN